MQFDRETAFRRLDQAALWLTIAAVAAGIALLVLRALVHFPFFDESIHMRYLWMISDGMKPGTDFFATYPVFAYFFLAPILKVLPDSAWVLLVFRFISMAAFIGVGVLMFGHGKRTAGDWTGGLFALVLLAASSNVGPFLVELSIDHFAALAAVGAMILFFRQPDQRRLALASALCLLSVAITPKYALPLFFGLAGFIVSAGLAGIRLKKLSLSVAAGGIAVALLVIAAYALYGVSLAENIETAYVVTSKIALKMHKGELSKVIYMNFRRRPVLGVLLLLGVAGWAKRSWRKADSITLAGAGVIIGLVIFCLRMSFPAEQYQAPVYISLSLFSPFAPSVFGQKTGPKIARALLAASVLTVAIWQIRVVMGEFKETNLHKRDIENPKASKVPPGFKSLPELDNILKKIPRGERVVAMWAHHPMLRRDVTGMIVDERPSYVGALDSDAPQRRFFDPAYLREELQKRPPALIDTFFLNQNYPPGWDKVVSDYLAKNMALYQPVPSPILKGWFFYMRKDLVTR